MEAINHWLTTDGLSILLIAIGAALLYFIGGWMVSLFMRQVVKTKERSMPKKDIEKREKTLVGLSVSVWRIVIVVVALVSVLKIIFPKLELSPLFASAGIVGIAVAFGSQALVKDFLTGLFIVSDNQFRVGDVVEINGAEGRVEKLGTRSTVIRDFDGNVHYIPNGNITSVINKTMGYSRVNFPLSLAADTDLDAAINIINQVGQDLAKNQAWQKKILSPPQFDSISQISGSKIDVKIVGKVQPSDQWSVTAEMRRRLLEQFEKNKITLAN